MVTATSAVQDENFPTEVPAQPYESDEDRELREAQAALAAAQAEAAKPAEPAAPAEPKPADSAPVVEVKDKPGEAKPPVMVPVAALKGERDARQKAEQEAAYLRGVAETALLMANKPTAGDQQQQDELTPQQRLDQIREQRLALADQFDTGEISARKFEENRLELEAKEREIRESAQPKAAPAAPAQDLILEERTSQLEKDYPVLQTLTQEDVEPLVAIAYREAAKEGKPIQPGSAGTLELRTRVAQIATRLHGTPAAAPVKPNQSGSTPVVPAGVTVQQKADLAANHPVDAGSLGSAGSGAPISDAELESKLNAMSEDEQIAFLDSQPALMQRVMGRHLK